MGRSAVHSIAIAMGLALFGPYNAARQDATKVTRDGLIVFSSNRDGTFRLYSCDEDGSNVQLATKGEGADAYPAWSPTGDRIAFASGKTLTLLDWKTKTRQSLGVEIDPEMCLLSWSSEGDRILCNSGDELVIVDVATRKMSKAVDPKVMKDCGTGTWMPDGRTLLVSSGSCAPTLRTLAKNGTVTDFLTTTPMFTFVPQLGGVWSTATPHRVGFTALNLRDPKIVDAMKKRILDGKSDDAVTQGDLAAFDMGDVYVTAEDGRNPTKVFSTPGLDWAWGWSPDGQALLVTSTYMILEEKTSSVATADKHADADLFIVDVGTDRKINLTKDAALERGASWRPVVASPSSH